MRTLHLAWSTVIAATLVCCSPAGAPPSVPKEVAASPRFRTDGLASALAEARRLKKPLAVEIWAPWCPPCMSMRAGAFDAPEVKALADSFVWLAIDRDTPEGESISKQDWHVDTLPSVVLIDWETSTPFAEWTSGLTGAELAVFLNAASSRAEGAAELFGTSANARGKREDRRGRLLTMADRAGANWPLAPFAIYQAVRDAALANDHVDCLAVASRWAERMPRRSLRLSVISAAITCARALGGDHVDEARRWARALDESIRDPTYDVLSGDRSGYYSEVYEVQKALGDLDGSARTLADWVAYLRAEYVRSPSTARAVLSAHLLLALYERGERASAIPSLLEAERLLPDDDNISLRAARELAEAGRIDDALDATNRAIAKAPWPRRLEALWEKSKLYAKKNDRDGEAEVLRTAIAMAGAEALPPRFQEIMTNMKNRLAALATTTGLRKEP